MTRKHRGKIIVITGGSSGIGAAAARRLKEQGAHVVITGRSEKTKHIAREIGADYYLVDYTSFADVSRVAKALTDKYDRIDVLVNNAGAVLPERRLTQDGNEMTLQVNHLSGFLLTLLLRPTLEASNASVINTSSAAHAVGRLDFRDLQSERRYSPWLAYGTSKLMNILHAIEINRRFHGVHAVSFHPGSVATSFTREMHGFIRWIYESACDTSSLSRPSGVRTRWFGSHKERRAETGYPEGITSNGEQGDRAAASMPKPPQNFGTSRNNSWPLG